MAIFEAEQCQTEMLSATFIDQLSDMFPSNNVARNKIRPLPKKTPLLYSILVGAMKLYEVRGFMRATRAARICLAGFMNFRMRFSPK